MGFPAARLTDMHTCPMCMGVPAPIVFKCAFTVLTGSMPQARVTDMCACVGPPPPLGGDPIVTGAWNVLVEKLPAARMTDLTAKGGAIVTGFPTVLIGMQSGGPSSPSSALGSISEVTMPDGSTVTKVGNNITIEGTPEFREKVLNDLRILGSTETGTKLLDSIDSGSHSVTIVETGGGNAAGYSDPAARFENADGTPGAGSDSTVSYNPTRTQIGDGSEPWMTRPPAVGLGHELIHAEQASHGRQHNGSTDGTRNRERQAVGLPPYENNELTENNIRRDLGEPERTYY